MAACGQYPIWSLAEEAPVGDLTRITKSVDAERARAQVIAMPEPGIAYLDAGKQELPSDEGLSELHLLRRGGGVTIPLANHDLFAMNDQPSQVWVPADSPLRVGDVVRLGLSHPSTAFDKWSLIPVLDDSSADDPVAVDLVRTYF